MRVRGNSLGHLAQKDGGRQIPVTNLPIHHLPFTCRILSSHRRPFLFDMSRSSSPSTFQNLFNVALQDYKDKTGNSLVHHPFAKQLQECDSVESISTILEDQARVFREFRDHGKLINSLKRVVDVLCSPFISTVLVDGIGLVVRPKPFVVVHYC